MSAAISSKGFLCPKHGKVFASPCPECSERVKACVTAPNHDAATTSNLPVVVQGWLNDIDRALRDVFTSESEEDEAFDSATYGLDALRAYLEKEASRG